MLRSAYFTVMLTGLGSSAAETALKLEASAPKISESLLSGNYPGALEVIAFNACLKRGAAKSRKRRILRGICPREV